MEQEIDKNKTTIIELLEPLIRKDVPFLHLCTKESSKDDFEFWHIVVDELQRGKLSKKLLINFGTKDNIFNKVLCFRFRLPYSLLDPRSRNNMNDNQEYFAYHYSHGFTFPLISINFYKENLINISKINEEYANVVLKCLSYELEERYDNCNQLKEILINIQLFKNDGYVW